MLTAGGTEIVEVDDEEFQTLAEPMHEETLRGNCFGDGVFLLFGGLVALLQVLVAVVVPALVLFFIILGIRSTVGSD